jgi:hypothetical protein
VGVACLFGNANELFWRISVTNSVITPLRDFGKLTSVETMIFSAWAAEVFVDGAFLIRQFTG